MISPTSPDYVQKVFSNKVQPQSFTESARKNNTQFVFKYDHLWSAQLVENKTQFIAPFHVKESNAFRAQNANSCSI